MKETNIVNASKLTSPNPLTLVCTKKEDGNTNIATVSWYTYLSFNPGMIGFAMSKQSYSGEMIRKNKKVILAMPGSELQDIVMKCGASTGRNIDKVKEFNIELEDVTDNDIKIPANTRIAITLDLKEYVEVGDHYFYICTVDKVYCDENKTPLFAFNGYSKIETV